MLSFYDYLMQFMAMGVLCGEDEVAKLENKPGSLNPFPVYKHKKVSALSRSEINELSENIERECVRVAHILTLNTIIHPRRQRDVAFAIIEHARTKFSISNLNSMILRGYLKVALNIPEMEFQQIVSYLSMLAYDPVHNAPPPPTPQRVQPGLAHEEEQFEQEEDGDSTPETRKSESRIPKSSYLRKQCSFDFKDVHEIFGCRTPSLSEAQLRKIHQEEKEMFNVKTPLNYKEPEEENLNEKKAHEESELLHTPAHRLHECFIPPPPISEEELAVQLELAYNEAKLSTNNNVSKLKVHEKDEKLESESSDDENLQTKSAPNEVNTPPLKPKKINPEEIEFNTLVRSQTPDHLPIEVEEEKKIDLVDDEEVDKIAEEEEKEDVCLPPNPRKFSGITLRRSLARRSLDNHNLEKQNDVTLKRDSEELQQRLARTSLPVTRTSLVSTIIPETAAPQSRSKITLLRRDTATNPVPVVQTIAPKPVPNIDANIATRYSEPSSVKKTSVVNLGRITISHSLKK